MKRYMILGCLLVLAMGLSRNALAVEVFFNGVRVSGLKNQSFKNCGVRFDGDGSVHITAKGYSVKRVDQTGGGQAAAKTPGVSKQYYLYAKSSKPGFVQYDIDVYINGKWVKKIRNAERQVVLDISRKLRKGKNVIHFAATKNYGGKGRLSTSAADEVKVFIGLGSKGGGTVNITTTLADFKANANSTKNFGREQTITVP
jgi:hypothetical protein